eukprot:SAG31_NODE_20796_length_565_cov_0.881974_1_plen_144_part_01
MDFARKRGSEWLNHPRAKPSMGTPSLTHHHCGQAKALRRPVTEFGDEDALNYACLKAHEPGAWQRGVTEPWVAASGSGLHHVKTMMASDPLRRLGSLDMQSKVLRLAAARLREEGKEQPEMVVIGLLFSIWMCCHTPEVCRFAV